MTPEKAAIYWEARARALEKRLEAARSRLLAMANALPPETLEILEMDVMTLEASRWAECAVTGIEDSLIPIPSDVEAELKMAFARLRLPEAPAN